MRNSTKTGSVSDSLKQETLLRGDAGVSEKRTKVSDAFEDGLMEKRSHVAKSEKRSYFNENDLRKRSTIMKRYESDATHKTQTKEKRSFHHRHHHHHHHHMIERPVTLDDTANYFQYVEDHPEVLQQEVATLMQHRDGGDKIEVEDGLEDQRNHGKSDVEVGEDDNDYISRVSTPARDEEDNDEEEEKHAKIMRYRKRKKKRHRKHHHHHVKSELDNDNDEVSDIARKYLHDDTDADAEEDLKLKEIERKFMRYPSTEADDENDILEDKKLRLEKENLEQKALVKSSLADVLVKKKPKAGM